MIYKLINIPSALLSKYQSATNWAYFSSRFVGLDIDIGDGDSGNLIAFTIDGTEYQAEEGMTWAEWCESGYNTDDYSTSFGMVVGDLGRYVGIVAGLSTNYVSDFEVRKF